MSGADLIEFVYNSSDRKINHILNKINNKKKYNKFKHFL